MVRKILTKKIFMLGRIIIIMADSKIQDNVFLLPDNWKLIGTGKNKYHADLENDYFVIETKLDILTALVYSADVDFRHMTELASWTFVRRVKINEHDGYIHMHPEGYRKMLAWYCPDADRTFMINFSIAQDEVVQTFRKSHCHK